LLWRTLQSCCGERSNLVVENAPILLWRTLQSCCGERSNLVVANAPILLWRTLQSCILYIPIIHLTQGYRSCNVYNIVLLKRANGLRHYLDIRTPQDIVGETVVNFEPKSNWHLYASDGILGAEKPLKDKVRRCF
jgi:hypothetical protein